MTQPNRKTWYLGLLVGADEGIDLFDIIEASSKNAAKTQIGWGQIYRESSHAVESAVPDMNVNIGPGKYICPDGMEAEWLSAQVVDMSTANMGTLQGSTTVSAAGLRKFVVVAVHHKYTDADATVDELGAAVYYSQNSSFEFKTWMTAEVPVATDWYSSSILRSLIEDIIAADYCPIALGVRDFGDTTLVNANLYEIPRHYNVFGKNHAASHNLLNEILSTSNLPMILTGNGLVNISGVAVPGQEGKIIFTGGERIMFVLDGENGHRFLYTSVDEEESSIYIETIPAGTEIDFNGQGDEIEFILRAKLDPNTLSVTYYAGTGNYPEDTPVANQNGGTAWMTGAGFPVTWVDIPLAIINTNGSGAAPSVTTSIACDWRLRTDYIENRTVALLERVNQPCLVRAGATPLSDGGGLNLIVGEMTFLTRRGEATVPNATIALTDNTENLIYADLRTAPYTIDSVDIAIGGGPFTNPSIVPLGIVTTAGVAITAIYWNPLTAGVARTNRILGGDWRVYNKAGSWTLEIKPCSVRAQPTSTYTHVFHNPHYTELSLSLNNSFKTNAVPVGATWCYIYADPGGTHGPGGVANDRCYINFLVDVIGPNVNGFHPTAPTLVYMGAFYWDAANFTTTRKCGDIVTFDDNTPAVVDGNAIVQADTSLSANGLAPVTANKVLLDVMFESAVAPAAYIGYLYGEESAATSLHTLETYLAAVADNKVIGSLWCDTYLISGLSYFGYKVDNANLDMTIYVNGWQENVQAPASFTYPIVTGH